ncbi:MAG: hypothetical protein AB9844_10350 [Clostridiaceae bacterium]
MSIKSIKNKDIFRVLDEKQEEIHYGCDQEWYETEWQRKAGCGPTVASNLVHYIKNKEISACFYKDTCLSLMEEVWNFVTPARHGINTTKMFCELFLTYAREKRIDVEARICDLPKERFLRPQMPAIVRFLKEGLSEDSPVAFLNLCNGDEPNLQYWHWVTIISVEYEKTDQKALINIMDEGKIKNIDLDLWYRTTTLGGGFVYFVSNE